MKFKDKKKPLSKSGRKALATARSKMISPPTDQSNNKGVMQDSLKIELTANQNKAFAISLSIFLIAALFGWIRLRYGFNFIDEGYQMTESWRLAVGDDFLKDKFTGALKMFTLINALIFKTFPNITLLDFRELEYTLTILSLFLLTFALYTVDKKYWFQPFIFSVFAFTGLDPIGNFKNLCYQTYPHLFIILHLALLIIGLHQRSPIIARTLYILSGVCLWLISFSLLHMSLIVLSPILIFLIIKTLKIEILEFTLYDLCFVLAPFLLFWLIFLGIFNKPFIQNVFSSLHWMRSMSVYSTGALISINWGALDHIIITIPFVLVFLFSTKLSKTLSLVGSLLILAIIMYIIIETSLFGSIPPYYRGWFDRPMWFTALLVSSYFVFVCYFIFKALFKKQWDKLELYGLIIIIPTIIMAISNSIFSASGILTVLYSSSITGVAGITCMILSLKSVEKRSYDIKLIVILLFFTPFYFTSIFHYWEWTYFDVSPKLATVEIDEGFGKGIRTNQTYKDLYTWISITSQEYSKKDDYIISYIVSPMVYMIAKRKPALDDTFTDFHQIPVDNYKQVIDFMREGRREPRLAYVFEAMPALVLLEGDRFSWFDKQFSFPGNDPISKYILENMVLVDNYRLAPDFIVKCFVDRKSNLRIPVN